MSSYNWFHSTIVYDSLKIYLSFHYYKDTYNYYKVIGIYKFTAVEGSIKSFMYLCYEQRLAPSMLHITLASIILFVSPLSVFTATGRGRRRPCQLISWALYTIPNSPENRMIAYFNMVIILNSRTTSVVWTRYSSKVDLFTTLANCLTVHQLKLAARNYKFFGHLLHQFLIWNRRKVLYM